MRAAEREVLRRGIESLGAKSLSSLSWSFANGFAACADGWRGGKACEDDEKGALDSLEASQGSLGSKEDGAMQDGAMQEGGDDFFQALKVAMRKGVVFQSPVPAPRGGPGSHSAGAAIGAREEGRILGREGGSRRVQSEGGGGAAAGGWREERGSGVWVGDEDAVPDLEVDVDRGEEDGDGQRWEGQQFTALVAGIALFCNWAPGRAGGQVSECGNAGVTLRTRRGLRDALYAMIAEVRLSLASSPDKI